MLTRGIAGTWGLEALVLGCSNLLLLELCWAVPGLLVSEWTRNI